MKPILVFLEICLLREQLAPLQSPPPPTNSGRAGQRPSSRLAVQWRAGSKAHPLAGNEATRSPSPLSRMPRTESQPACARRLHSARMHGRGLARNDPCSRPGLAPPGCLGRAEERAAMAAITAPQQRPLISLQFLFALSLSRLLFLPPGAASKWEGEEGGELFGGEPPPPHRLTSLRRLPGKM